MIYILLILSLALLVVGANWLVDGAAAIARRYHISEYIIGATIVGSNIFNVFFILGVTALMMPIQYTRDNIRRDIPINIGASVIVIILCAAGILWRGQYGLGRIDGVLMLCLFALYLWSSLRGGRELQAPSEDTSPAPTGLYRHTMVCVTAIVAGLAGLIYGGGMFVDAASAIAREWGVSEAIIGLTIVAGGTSLPELVSSVIAVAKQKEQMALGNIVGSNIFNLLLILGAAAVISPLTMGDITFIDWGVMLLSALALLAASYTFKKRQLDRKDALIFLLIYVGYMAWLCY